MKKNPVGRIASILILILCFCLMASCAGDPSKKNNSGDPGSSVQKYTREYWGEWKKMDQTETWEINSTSIKVNGSYLSKDVVLSKPSENVISVTDNKTTYCLYAIRTASSSILGSVSKDDGSKDLSSGWLSVVVENVNDRYDVTNTTTDANGHFSADKLIPGEDYRIRVEDTVLTVRPSFDGEDIGNIKLKSGVNFKVTLSNANEIMYAGTDFYSMDLLIENIGDTNCTAATYTLVGDDGLTVKNNYTDGILLRTVAAGEKKTLPLEVRCDVPESATTVKKLNLTITDKDGTVWNDSVSLKFYKGTTTIDIVSENDRPISGVIIGDGRTYTITNRDNYSIEVPATEEGYLLVFSGAIANAAKNTEAIYSIGIDEPAIKASDLLSVLGAGTNSYEPNDDENNAKKILNGEAIVSYLFENDIDYYQSGSGHVWDEGVVTKKASCTDTGIKVVTCTICGKTKEVIIPSHDWIEKEVTPATTISTGLIKYECSVCGIKKEETIPMLRYSVGGIGPAGGYIIYDCDADNDKGNGDKLVSTECGWKYLEAAPADLKVIDGIPTVDSSASGYAENDNWYAFGCYRLSNDGPIMYVNGRTEYSISDCTKTVIGSGSENTRLLVNAMGTEARVNAAPGTTDEYAARLCDILEYEINGVTFSDWFLPSKDELALVYTVLYLKGKSVFATKSSCYWSSSEDSEKAGYAWTKWFMGSPDVQGYTYCYNGGYIRPIRAF